LLPTLASEHIRTGFVENGKLVVYFMFFLRQDLAMALLFGIGYAGIIFEEFLAFNKSGVGLLMAVSLWVIRSIGVRFILFAYLPKLILLLYLSSFFN
jgi:hypothetical protein